AALFDDRGICLAVASLPPSYKPLLEQGAGRMSTVNIYITVNNIADVQLITDPAIILATITEVDKAKGEAKDYADEIVG
ncbi:phage tail protein, partial [Klebsiella pneumoniae]